MHGNELERWLNSDEEAFNGPFPSKESESFVKKQIWSAIQSRIGRNKSKIALSRVGKIATFTAAACVILVSFSLIDRNTSLLSRISTIDNTSNQKARFLNVGQFHFTIEHNTAFRIEQHFFGGQTSVKFCGAVSVKSLSKGVMDLDFYTGLFNCKMKIHDNVNLRRGQTYLAMTDGQYDMISATQDELMMACHVHSVQDWKNASSFKDMRVKKIFSIIF